MTHQPPLMARPTRQLVATLALALAGGLVGALSLPATAQPAGPGPGMHRGQHDGPRAGGHGGAGPMMAMSERMLDQVSATTEQRAQIRQILQSAATDLKSQRDAARGLREQQLALLAAPTVDAAAVEVLRQKELAQHDTVTRRMTQAMVDASRVLTPDQRSKLGETMKARRAMMERHHRERQSLAAPKS